MKRFLVPVVAAGLLSIGAVACSGESAADAESFCNALVELSEDDAAGSDPDPSADASTPDLAVEGFERLAERSPAAIADDTERLAEITRELTVLAEDPEAAADIALPLLGELDEIAGRVAAFAQANCPDLPPGVFSS